ncbi:hypothetical protein [Halorhabdus sp. CUG00001]|uniref:hypothetical protein n=1 Tax=Halorhabdus sp. CUG00001 TaxID=2600297 RepID=UPI00131C969A|nr:hypothetical protein [Halorhabdus sp. CUG00001]
MSVDNADVDAVSPDRQLACPTNTSREPEPIDADDPRVTEDGLCSHCFPDGIPEDVETLLRIGRYDKGIHLPKSYDGERCIFGSYDGYTTYEYLLDRMTIEEWDQFLDGELTLDEIKQRIEERGSA